MQESLSTLKKPSEQTLNYIPSDSVFFSEEEIVSPEEGWENNYYDSETYLPPVYFPDTKDSEDDLTDNIEISKPLVVVIEDNIELLNFISDLLVSNNYRVKKAQIAIIACLVSFSDSNYFTRVFMEYFGKSPKQYLKDKCNNPTDK